MRSGIDEFKVQSFFFLNEEKERKQKITCLSMQNIFFFLKRHRERAAKNEKKHVKGIQLLNQFFITMPR